MQIHTNKNQERKSRPIISRTRNTQKKSAGTFQFMNNRSEVVVQRKLQEMAQAKQVVQLQEIVNNDSEQQKPIQKKENKTGLPHQLKSGIESLSGYSMDDVRVHYNSNKPAQLNAHAYAQGVDIHLASGQEKHLPHEAWHVVQQKQGRVAPSIQMKNGLNVNNDESLEQEADVMSVKAVSQMSTGSVKTSPHKINPVSLKEVFQLKTTKAAVVINKILLIAKDKKYYVKDMDPLIETILDKYGDLEIPSEHRSFKAKSLYLRGKILEMNGATENNETRLLAYLVSGKGSRPGLGSLAKIRLHGNQIMERPGFSSATLKSVKIKTSQARRHITAWHNIRSYLNKILAADHKKFLNETAKMLKNLKQNEEYKEGIGLVAKMPDVNFGSFSKPEGKQIISTAYMMNSQPENLWPGGEKENSEIALFSAHFQAKAQKNEDYDELADWVEKCNISSSLGKAVQADLVKKIKSKKEKGLQAYLEEIKPLEIDSPPDKMTKAEEKIHERVFQVVFLGKPINWKTDLAVVKWFLNRP